MNMNILKNHLTRRSTGRQFRYAPLPPVSLVVRRSSYLCVGVWPNVNIEEINDLKLNMGGVFIG